MTAYEDIIAATERARIEHAVTVETKFGQIADEGVSRARGQAPLRRVAGLTPDEVGRMSDDRLFDMEPSDGRPKWLRLQEEAAKRDAAVEQVEKNADEEWKEKALVVIETLATYRPRFTTDDLWELIERPREPRAAGALMTKAHRAGWIRPLEEWQTLGSHRRPIRVWESRLYRGQS